jgi:hypothetical protein
MSTSLLELKGYARIPEPEVGEYVTMHLWQNRGKDDKTWRAIFIGPKPWGPRGARSGVVQDADEIVRSDDFKDDNVEMLLADLLSKAIHLNQPDSDVVTYCGDGALTLRDQGFLPGRAFLHCPKCSAKFSADRLSGQFLKGTSFVWATRKSHGKEPSMVYPKKVGNSICLSCVRQYRQTVEHWVNGNEGRQGKSVLDLASEGISPPEAISPESFKPLLAKVDRQIEAIEQGR